MIDSLGVWLRRSRETRKVDLEDVVRALRIRRRYLQALELGDYEALPGPIQARGFLRNYARYLGLPTEEALARYDAEVRGLPVQPRVPEIEAPSRNGLRTWAPPPPSVEEERAAVLANSSSGLIRLLVAVIVFFGLVALASLAWLQFGQDPAAGALVPTPAATLVAAAPLESLATPQSTPSFAVSADGTVTVRLVPLSHAWVSISADESVVFQGMADPEQVIVATAGEILIVSTGNGGAFEVYVNGTDWGTLGGQGEIVRRAWTPQGETSLEGS